MPAVSVSPQMEREASPRRNSRLPLAMVALASVVVLASFWYERYQPWALALVMAAYVTYVDSTNLWRKNRAIAITILVDILLVFAYLWSLDESVHVMIRASGGTYRATVGNTVVSTNRQTTGAWVGLDSGSMWDYRVQPTGEAIISPPSSPMERLGQTFRLATPKPAWANIVVTSNAGTGLVGDPSQLAVYSGNWSINRRGELEGDIGSNALIRAVPSGNFTISADLMRPDGMQGILVGIGSSLTGNVFAVRMDRPDAGWFVWDRTKTPKTLALSFIDVSTVSMIQRTVRLLLGNVIFALVFLLFALPLYVLFHAMLRADRRARSRLRALQRALHGTRLLDIAAGVMAAAALSICALFAWGQLQGVPHVQDSVADLFQAKTLALGRLSVPTPKPYVFFQEEFIDNFRGQWFGKYPPGWPLILAVGVLAHLPWLVNPILAAVCLGLLYLTGREVYGRTVAALAAVLALTSPFFLFLAGSYMPHTATLAYAVGFAYLIARWVVRSERRELAQGSEWYLLVPAGFLLGMAFITRQLDAIAFAAPFAAILLWKPRLSRLAAVRWVILGALPPAIFVLIYNRALTGNPFRSPYALWWPWDTIGFSDTLQIGFGPALGFWNTSLNLEYLMAHLFGWPFYCALGVAAIPFVLGRANRWDAVFGASALAVIAAYVFYWNPGTMFGPRYYYVAIPWFALLTARGFEELYRLPMRIGMRLRPNRLAALVVPTVLLTMLLAYNFVVYLPAQLPIYKGYNFVSAGSLQAVERANIHNALVFVVSNPPGEWWSYGSVFSANSPLLNGDIVYAHDLGPKDTILRSKYPGRAYYRLNGLVLTRIAGH